MIHIRRFLRSEAGVGIAPVHADIVVYGMCGLVGSVSYGALLAAILF